MHPLHQNILNTHMMEVVRGALRTWSPCPCGMRRGARSTANSAMSTVDLWGKVAERFYSTVRSGCESCTEVLQPCKGGCRNMQGGLTALKGVLQKPAGGAYNPVRGVAETRKGVLQPCKGGCGNPQGGLTALKGALQKPAVGSYSTVRGICKKPQESTSIQKSIF